MKKINASRRDVIKCFAGAGLLGLTGCCCRTSRPESEISFEDNSYDDQLFLMPKPVKGNMCIDVHAHFINATDVNVKGYMEGPIARTMESETLRKLVRKLAGVIDTLAKIAPTANDEYMYLTDEFGDISFNKKSTQEIRVHLFDEIDKSRDRIAKELYKEMIDQGVDDLYIKALNDFYVRAGLAPNTKQKFTEETVRNAMDPSLRMHEFSLLSSDAQMKASSLDPSGIIEFAGHMLSYRWQSFLTYQKTYTEDNNSFGVDAVFASLVDFDYWLECIPASSREDQVKLMSLMSMMSGGYMQPIVSYNPWTDIKDDDASFKLVKKAIIDYGFIGVKIYPANGFYPYGNEKLTVKTSQPRPDLKLLDEKLLVMFKWCADNNIPVMAHAAQTMGSDAGADKFGGPEGWRELLAKFQNTEKVPVINAGHFGGASAKNNWPASFGEIMKTPAGRKFYADTGYWTDLANCSSQCLAKKRIEQSLTSSDGIAKDRIMYGSDWLMSSKEPGWSRYPFKIQQQIKGLLPSDLFFHKNALAFYGFEKDSERWNDIIQRFEKQPGGLPGWLKL